MLTFKDMVAGLLRGEQLIERERKKQKNQRAVGESHGKQRNQGDDLRGSN